MVVGCENLDCVKMSHYMVHNTLLVVAISHASFLANNMVYYAHVHSVENIIAVREQLITIASRTHGRLIINSSNLCKAIS